MSPVCAPNVSRVVRDGLAVIEAAAVILCSVRWTTKSLVRKNPDRQCLRASSMTSTRPSRDAASFGYFWLNCLCSESRVLSGYVDVAVVVTGGAPVCLGDVGLHQNHLQLACKCADQCQQDHCY